MSGARALSLHEVAARAFVSVGAVYQRWASKDECVSSMIHDVLPKTLSGLVDSWSSASSLSTVARLHLTDLRHLQDLRFLTECLLAARDDHSLAPLATRATQELLAAVRTRFDPHPHQNAIAWWVVSTWLGYALLVTSGCHVPSTMPDAVATMLESSTNLVPDSFNVSAADRSTPASSQANATRNEIALDPLGQGMLRSTRDGILQHGIEATDVRSIAREQGVTTGAIYRRFAGKSEMLERVLERELPFNKRAWVPQFTSALAEGGADAAAAVLASATETVWTDRATSHLLLEFTVAAHGDESILRKLHESITKSADERQRLFEVLINEGLIRADLAPATAAWMLQIPPIGMRILGAVDVVPDTHGLAALIAGYLRYIVSNESEGN